MGGFFGVIAKKRIACDLFYGTDYHSHLGTQWAGIVTFDESAGFTLAVHNIERSYFKTKFEDDLEDFAGNSGIGVISDNDPQPVWGTASIGQYAVVTVAKINNIREIALDLQKEGSIPDEVDLESISQTELVSYLINQGDDFKTGINNVYKSVNGSCSMLILTENGIIAARDYLGRTPIILAKGKDGYVVCSESCSLPNLDYEVVRNLGPGEIVRVTADGVEILQPAVQKEQICSFLWVYYGFPTSSYDGCNVEEMRERCGRIMGQEDDVYAQWVCGVPDSGIGFALGYSEGRHMPYRRAVIKYNHTWPRSFMPAHPEQRQLVAKMKLIANDSLLHGGEVVFCDDSIVRGTQLRDGVNTFYKGGVRSVHARISCPPVMYSCPFIGFTYSESDLELITRRIIEHFEGNHNIKLEKYATYGTPEYKAMVCEIAGMMRLTSLKFSKIEDMVSSIGLPKERLCTHCFDGTGSQPCEAWRRDRDCCEDR